MYDEEAVEPQAEPIEQVVEEAQAEPVAQEGNDQSEKPSSDKTMIPLSVAQKLRQQKRELELELQWEKQRNAQVAQPAQKAPDEDNSRYESATREEVRTSQEQTLKMMEERLWIRNNPEKYEKIIEYLPTFLKQRPNLARAIDEAPNRYEEAFTLMEALTPKQQQQLKKDTAAPPKKEAPNSPGGVPKAAALNEAVEFSNMTDAEFNAWRASKRKRR